MKSGDQNDLRIVMSALRATASASTANELQIAKTRAELTHKVIHRSHVTKLAALKQLHCCITSDRFRDKIMTSIKEQLGITGEAADKAIEQALAELVVDLNFYGRAVEIETIVNA